ncbi:transcription factor TFIIIC subunit tfc4 [Chytriomyces hyalinus]|nr:transcription factor TFIIIC subunit tfc4 [Chytriomyces hyalinus]
MGQVSHLYASKDYPNAFKLLHEIIREDHKAAAAWKLLAVLHDELGNPAKALQANFIAAHLDPKDADLWTRLADISMTNGNKPDALYCYTKAISADPTNVENWYQRSVMYVDQGQIYKAISGFTSILQINPYEMRAIQELSRIYIQLHESNKAVKLFEAALEADARDPLPAVVEEDDDDDDFDEDMGNAANKGKAAATELDPKLRRWRVGYAELLNLLELYLDIGEYEQGCVATEIVVGRIELGILDGSVYGISPELHSNVPLEIRVKYGICKLWLDDHESAKTHFDALLEAEVEHYSDLFIDIIDAYMKKRMFALAVGILEVVVTNDCMNVASVWAKMAYCFQHLGRLDDAADLYKAAIEVEPREYDWQLQLAEIYEALGETEKANEIVDEVNERTRADAADSTVRTPRRRKGPLATQSTSGSIQFQTPRYEKSMAYPFDEEGEESDDDEGFNENGEGGEHAEALPGFLKTIKSDKAAREDKAVLLAAERLAIAENREWYGKLLILGDKLAEPVKRYAMALTMDKKDEDAYLALKAALDANVFYHNETLKLQLRMYMIASALICENFGRVVELAKAFCTNRPLENDMYRLYCAVLNGGGPDAVSAFASNICQKQFARTAKTFEVHLTKNPNSEIHKSPILMCLCGHILMCARSYWGAIRLYLDAYKMAPKDPLINLSLGLAYLHAGMQRRVDDRHKRILQAFTFLYQYEELRNHSPEALYNVGRAFHQIGLNHIAVEYYEKVLAADDGNESLWPIREAAYNMSMILVASGSNAYAQAILQKHLHF